MVRNILALTIKSIALLVLVGAITQQISECEKSFSPIKEEKKVIVRVEIKQVPKQELKKDSVEEALVHLGAPIYNVKKLAHAIRLTSNEVKVSPLLLCALMKTESEFKSNAKSPKNYKGLMQTPTSTGFEEVDTLHGGKILKEKLQSSNGNLETALAYYKGKGGEESHKQARQVLKIYSELCRIFKEDGSSWKKEPQYN